MIQYACVLTVRNLGAADSQMRMKELSHIDAGGLLCTTCCRPRHGLGRCRHPWTTEVARHIFSVTAPSVWNSLSADV